MPNNYDFSELKNVKTLEVSSEGWTSPLFVEYGHGIQGGIPSYFWRIKGTNHTFVIPIIRMDYLSQGDYEKHFKEILSAFREDYIGWSEEKWYADWMQKYRDQFVGFISL